MPGGTHLRAQEVLIDERTGNLDRQHSDIVSGAMHHASRAARRDELRATEVDKFFGIVVKLGCSPNCRDIEFANRLADVPELLKIAFVDDVDALGKPIPKTPAYDL